MPATFTNTALSHDNRCPLPSHIVPAVASATCAWHRPAHNASVRIIAVVRLSHSLQSLPPTDSRNMSGRISDAAMVRCNRQGDGWTATQPPLPVTTPLTVSPSRLSLIPPARHSTHALSHTFYPTAHRCPAPPLDALTALHPSSSGKTGTSDPTQHVARPAALLLLAPPRRCHRAAGTSRQHSRSHHDSVGRRCERQHSRQHQRPARHRRLVVQRSHRLFWLVVLRPRHLHFLHSRQRPHYQHQSVQCGQQQRRGDVCQQCAQPMHRLQHSAAQGRTGRRDRPVDSGPGLLGSDISQCHSRRRVHGRPPRIEHLTHCVHGRHSQQQLRVHGSDRNHIPHRTRRRRLRHRRQCSWQTDVRQYILHGHRGQPGRCLDRLQRLLPHQPHTVLRRAHTVFPRLGRRPRHSHHHQCQPLHYRHHWHAHHQPHRHGYVIRWRRPSDR